MGAIAPSVLAGLGIGLPLGWLLSYLGSLPFFLGLFFFMLFGLVIGAVMFRSGQRRRPLQPRGLRLASALVVGVTWGTALTFEALEFPSNEANKALERVATLPAGTERSQVLHEYRTFLVRYLDERYPPGGVLGYFRWTVSGRRIPLSVAGLRTLAVDPDGWRWVVRVLLSVALLAFGVHSQVAGLARGNAMGSSS